jgi:hypothetical protein
MSKVGDDVDEVPPPPPKGDASGGKITPIVDRFVMVDDEGPQEMYNRQKKFVNKVRAYGSRRWGDWRVIDRMLRAYAVKDTTVISLIQ